MEISKDLVIPDYLKKAAQGAITNDVAALAGIGQKMPRISLRGRKFRVMVEGEEILRPTDELDVVILAVEPGKGKMVKTFYVAGYTPGDTKPPDCSSSNGITPDDWVANPQNSSCATCPKNSFGSATSLNGKPSKACKDSKRLYVTIPDTDKNRGLGLGVKGIVFNLGVPVTSLNSLSEFGKTVAKNQFPLPAVIVTMEMVDTEYPEIKFNIGGFLNESDAGAAINRSISRDWILELPSDTAIENKPNQESNGPQTKSPKAPKASKTLAAPPPPAASQNSDPNVGVEEGSPVSMEDVLGEWGG